MTWTREQIRSARQTHLKPVLESLGYRLMPLKNNNYEVCGLSRDKVRGMACTVVIKLNYWTCTDDQRSGNVIDFCMQILNMSFNQAMNIIVPVTSYDACGINVRSQRGKTGDFRQV